MSLTLIIGAGIAGLTAARRLASREHQILVIDKGRGPGGRLSTRRDGELRFDHGAQYLTARDAGFAAEVAGWESAGVVARWDARLVDLTPGSPPKPRASEHPRYVGTPGMSAICRHLAAGLEVRYSLRATALTRAGSGWQVTAVREDTGAVETLEAARVVVAVPDVQARTLLAGHLVLPETVTRPCWAAMVAFSGPVDAGWDGAFVSGSPLGWVSRESSKPQRPVAEAWVLHASAAWSAEHLEMPAEEVAPRLLAALAELLPGLTAPTHLRAHRWRYAQTVSPAGEACYLTEDGTLGVCGDWYLGGKIEAAYLSGTAVAGRLVGV